jgi:hypothetical protein
MGLGLVYTHNFSLSGGTANSNVDLGTLDFGGASAIRIEAHLTGKGSADAGDTLDIYLQEASDDGNETPTWDDRAHLGVAGASNTFDGSLTVSSAAPEKRIMQWQCYGTVVSVTDGNYEPSGSAGGSRLGVGAYKIGPLMGKKRSTLLGPGSRYRLRFENVDADADATWAGRVLIYLG